MIQAHFEPEWIWGDDSETTVFAQGYGESRTVIFSFAYGKDKPATSLANRICNSFHSLEVSDVDATFPNPDAMRQALWDAIRLIWPKCLQDPIISALDTVVDIDSVDSSPERIVWKAYSHPLFPRFIQRIANEDNGKTRVTSPDATVVDFTTLIRFEQLGGHGCATRVRLTGDPTDKFFVFKGIDFRTFLHYCDDEGDKIVQHLIRSWRKSDHLLLTMPRHPNVYPPPIAEVTIRFPNHSSVAPMVCGTLQPLYPGGDVGQRIEKSNERGERLPLELKAHWCANMAAAVAHTHRVARNYHMDIKPGNFLADSNDDLVLCDWEQTDSPSTTLAPEADGTWDVSVEQEQGGQQAGAGSVPASNRPRLRYTKYQGPPRQNVDEELIGDRTWHRWNVFTIWNLECPWALEVAEVFSLGRTMWMLLRQPNMDFDEIEHPDDLATDWKDAEDIPASWVQMVERCMSRDPNQRPDVLELAQFWESEWKCQQFQKAKE